MKYLAIILIAPLLLTACDRNRSEAEEAVRTRLKDPESARFGDFYYNAQTGRGCLTVNAKNSMGGYIGDQQALMERVQGNMEVLLLEEVTPQDCRKAHGDRKD